MMAQLAAGPGGLVAGSDGPDNAAAAAGHGHYHGHAHRHLSNSNFCPCLQMVAGARAIHKARSRRQNGGGGPSNVFDHGCWANCVEFWSDPNDGAINWYELYDVRQLQKPSQAV